MSQLLTLYTLVVYLYLDRFRLWLERRRVARVLRRRPAAESDALRVVGPPLFAERRPTGKMSYHANPLVE